MHDTKKKQINTINYLNEFCVELLLNCKFKFNAVILCIYL